MIYTTLLRMYYNATGRIEKGANPPALVHPVCALVHPLCALVHALCLAPLTQPNPS